jgi:ATP-dependent Clp protease ATP-binding subunit ClpC
MRMMLFLYAIFIIPLFSFSGFVCVLIWPFILPFTYFIYKKNKDDDNNLLSTLIHKSNNSLEKFIILLLDTQAISFTFERLGFSAESLKKYIKTFADKTQLKLTSEKFKSEDGLYNMSKVVTFLAQYFTPITSLLDKSKITVEDVSHCYLWYKDNSQIQKRSVILDLDKIKNIRGIGLDWSYGYTPELDKYSDDITIKNATFPLLVGRDKELEILQKTLIKTEENNILLVGDAGVGRHILIQTLARKILAGDCNHELAHKRVISLSMHSILSVKQTISETKGFINNLINEAENAGNIIIVIDEIDRYLTSEKERLDLTDIFLKFADSQIGFIGITTKDAYIKYIETNDTLHSAFEAIFLEPPLLDTLQKELELSISPVMEQKHKIIITYQAIKKVIENSDRYISSTPFPAKAIELLDETCIYVKNSKKIHIVTNRDVDDFLTGKINTPIGKLEKEEKEKLINLENYLHRRIINQNHAINAIAACLRRARLNISNNTKPIGSFLFLGPTGVGKTETAKALAETYFGDENRMIRFDMSQYQKEEGLERLIGSIKLATQGELVSKLKQSPFSLVLLDEIEKADKTVFNLLLTLLDEGYVSDSSNKKIDARNTIIIATSNAGAEYIRENLKSGIKNADLTKNLLDFIQKEKMFSPEFLNRFDGVIVFEPLSEGHLREVARLMLDSLNKRLSKQGFSVDITDNLVKKLASLGFDPIFGARSMRRAISDKVEDEIAKKVLKDEIKKGDIVEINF